MSASSSDSGAGAGGRAGRGEREAIADLMADYVHFIDDDRLEDWLELFAEDCSYRILSRENVDAGYPLELMSCNSKDMLRDRILSLREAVLYNVHTDKHVLGAVRVSGPADADGTPVWSVQANYSLYQTTANGETSLFSVGTYRDRVVFSNGRPLFAEKTVIADTFTVDRLLSTPI